MCLWWSRYRRIWAGHLRIRYYISQNLSPCSHVDASHTRTCTSTSKSTSRVSINTKVPSNHQVLWDRAWWVSGNAPPVYVQHSSVLLGAQEKFHVFIMNKCLSHPIITHTWKIISVYCCYSTIIALFIIVSSHLVCWDRCFRHEKITKYVTSHYVVHVSQMLASL